MEGDDQSLLGGRCKVRLFFFPVLICHLLEHAVGLCRSEGQDNDEREVVGSIDDYQQLLREGFDLLLIVQQADKRSQPVLSSPSHEEICA